MCKSCVQLMYSCHTQSTGYTVQWNSCIQVTKLCLSSNDSSSFEVIGCSVESQGIPSSMLHGNSTTLAYMPSNVVLVFSVRGGVLIPSSHVYSSHRSSHNVSVTSLIHTDFIVSKAPNIAKSSYIH